jgi:hypothetical protein
MQTILTFIPINTIVCATEKVKEQHFVNLRLSDGENEDIRRKSAQVKLLLRYNL